MSAAFAATMFLAGPRAALADPSQAEPGDFSTWDCSDTPDACATCPPDRPYAVFKKGGFSLSVSVPGGCVEWVETTVEDNISYMQFDIQATVSGSLIYTCQEVPGGTALAPDAGIVGLKYCWDGIPGEVDPNDPRIFKAKVPKPSTGSCRVEYTVKLAVWPENCQYLSEQLPKQAEGVWSVERLPSPADLSTIPIELVAYIPSRFACRGDIRLPIPCGVGDYPALGFGRISHRTSHWVRILPIPDSSQSVQFFFYGDGTSGGPMESIFRINPEIDHGTTQLWQPGLTVLAWCAWAPVYVDPSDLWWGLGWFGGVPVPFGGSTNAEHIRTYVNQSGRAVVGFEVDAGNGTGVGGHIRASIDLEFIPPDPCEGGDPCSVITVVGWGMHSGFPAFELLVDGVVIYSHHPCSHPLGPYNLTDLGIMAVPVNFTTTILFP